MKFFNSLKLSLSKKLLFFSILFSFTIPFIVFGADDLVTQVIGTISGLVGGATGFDISKAIIGAFIGMTSTISIGLLQYGLDFLNWTSSGDFLSGPITSNPLITEGWGAMRNLANILLIFGLVAIAISIMVGYAETKAKKMLIQFVITALLINFTPVLCGVFIDIANIVMASFLKGGVSQTYIAALENAKDVGSIESLPTMTAIALISILTFIVYMLYGLLFIVRYVWLWMLIIVSPIALSTRVFPSNEYIRYILPDICLWESWKENFLNWVFIGIPAAFSIWLSEKLMEAIVNNPTAVTSGPSGILGGAMTLIFSYSLPIIFLVMGFLMTVSKGGAAGQKIGGFGRSMSSGVWNRTGGKVTDFAKDQTVGRIDRAGRGIADGFSEGAATARTDAAARGEKAGLLRQITGGLKQSGSRAFESQTGNSDAKKNEDEAITKKAKEGFVAEIKSRTDKEKDVILAGKDNSIRARAQRDFIIKERADKGKLKDSEAALVTANLNNFEKETKEAVMKRMPHLVPQINASKRDYVDSNGKTHTRTDQEMITDFMSTEMNIAERKKIQLNSVMNHGSVRVGLDENEFSAIASKATTGQLKEIKDYETKVQDARNVRGGLASTTGIQDRAEADRIIAEAKKRDAELVTRLNHIKQIKINGTQDQIEKAKKEEKRLEGVQQARNRLINGMIL